MTTTAQAETATPNDSSFAPKKVWRTVWAKQNDS